MKSKEVAASLGHKTAKAMFEGAGYSPVLFHKLKEDKKVIKINQIILDHYSIDTSELVAMIKLYKVQHDNMEG